MSGYLQRLAGNAMTPARSIHPSVGSIFSPPKDEMPAPLTEFEEIQTVRNRAESVAQVPPAVPPRAIHAPASPESEALEDKPARNEGQSRPEAFRPIVPVPRRTAPLVSTPRQTLPQPKEPGPLRTVEAAQKAASPVESDGAYTPLLPPNVETPGTETELLPLTVVSAAPKKDPIAVPRRAAASRSEPDEIQIHIGRIEVTAVPQAVPRPAPAPPSKSINLDEYLKRGRGRA